MEEDDPPPAYHELLPMIGVQPRSQSPFKSRLDPESAPLNGPGSRPHTPTPTAPSAESSSPEDSPGPAPSAHYTYTSSSTSGGGHHSARIGGRASPNFTFTNETRSGTRTTNPDGSSFFNFMSGGPSGSSSGNNHAGQFFNTFFSDMDQMMGSGGPRPDRPTSGLSSLDRMVKDLPNSVRFEEGPAHSGNYEFYMRESMDCLLLKGNVSIADGIKMTTVNGEEFLNIANASGKYTVKHRTTEIGTLEVWTGNPQSIRIIRTYDRKAYSINFLGPKDIVISRANRGATICKIHASEPISKTSLAFEGSLVISDPSVTVIETCLCISLAVVFMAARNEIQLEAAKLAQRCDNTKWICACIGLVVFIIALAVMIKVLSDRQLERRKKMYPNTNWD